MKHLTTKKIEPGEFPDFEIMEIAEINGVMFYNEAPALRRLRRKIRSEAGPYTQISAEQVLAWINEELKRRKN